MSSIALRRNDICLANGSIVLDPTLESEVRMVLGIDARDNNEDQPRGYWANPSVGTLLWTRLHLPNNPETRVLIERDIKSGLEYMITSGIASEVQVTAAQGRLPGTVKVDLTIRRGSEVLLDLRFADLWQELGFAG